MQDFKDLIVWRKTHELSLNIYKFTRKTERIDKGLVWQTRRSVLSISYNIAEGCGRSSRTDQARFFQIARASASELECQLILLRDLGYIESETIKSSLTELLNIQKMLTKLIAFKRAKN